MKETILEIIAEMLQVDASSIDTDTDIRTIQTWDSLIQIQIIAEIEDQCNVSIPIESALTLYSIHDFLIALK